MPKTSAPATNMPDPKPRKLKTPTYRSFRLQKRIKTAAPALPSGFKLFVGSVRVLTRNWKPFLGIIVVYGVLTVLFVRGLSGGANLTELKQALEGAGDLGRLVTGATLFAYLLGSSGNTSSGVAGAYQLVLTLVASLALIWTLRQVYAGKKVRIRDGFYRGMYPLVPFVLVLCVVGLQLIPLLLGAFLYGTASANATMVTGVEQLLWGVMFFLLALISLYMLASSLLALYIVCLPDMQPLAALRSARELVRYRRWTVLRKVIFLPFILLVLAALLMIPLIMFAAPIAAWVFFGMSMAGLPIIHGYVYRLYRELL